jgi:hypothetical protein
LKISVLGVFVYDDFGFIHAGCQKELMLSFKCSPWPEWFSCFFFTAKARREQADKRTSGQVTEGPTYLLTLSPCYRSMIQSAFLSVS